MTSKGGAQNRCGVVESQLVQLSASYVLCACLLHQGLFFRRCFEAYSLIFTSPHSVQAGASDDGVHKSLARTSL